MSISSFPTNTSSCNKRPSSPSFDSSRAKRNIVSPNTLHSLVDIDMSDSDNDGQRVPLIKKDKGKGRMKFCPELPEHVWTRIFELVYQDYQDNLNDYHSSTTSPSCLAPLLLSHEHTRIALPVLYNHPVISYSQIDSFLRCITVDNSSYVRNLTISPSTPIPTPNQKSAVHPSLPDVLGRFRSLQTFTLKDTLISGHADAVILFNALSLIRPKKARLEIRLWDLHDSQIGADIIAANRPAIHIVYNGSPSPLGRLDPRIAPAERGGLMVGWHDALFQGRELHLPSWVIEPPRANHQILAAAAQAPAPGVPPTIVYAPTMIYAPTTVYNVNVPLGSASNPIPVGLGPTAPPPTPVDADPIHVPARSQYGYPIYHPAIVDPSSPAVPDPGTGQWSGRARSAASHANPLTGIAPMGSPRTPSVRGAASSRLRSTRAARLYELAELDYESDEVPRRRASGFPNDLLNTRKRRHRPPLSQTQIDYTTMMADAMGEDTDVDSVATGSVSESGNIEHDPRVQAIMEDALQLEALANAQNERRDHLLPDDWTLTEATLTPTVPPPKASQAGSSSNTIIQCFPNPITTYNLDNLPGLQPHELAHEMRTDLLSLIETWTPRLQAFSFVALDPLASMLVRAPNLDFWTRVPVPHVRVHLPRGCNSLAVFKGAAECARDRSGEDHPRVVGGDGHGGRLVHDEVRLFEIEVNTVKEMMDEVWMKCGDQLPAQLCRILVGEQDWRDLTIGPSISTPDLTYPPFFPPTHSQTSSECGSPTFSFASLDLDDDDGMGNMVGETYDALAAEEQARKVEERVRSRLGM